MFGEWLTSFNDADRAAIQAFKDTYKREAPVKSLVAKDQFSGAVLVARHGRIPFEKAYGEAQHRRHAVPPRLGEQDVHGRCRAATGRGRRWLHHRWRHAPLRASARPQEPLPVVSLVHLRENGPLAFLAPLRIAGKDEGLRATLCRCGLSKHKPFCDNSHAAGGFVTSGEREPKESQPHATRDGMLAVEPQRTAH